MTFYLHYDAAKNLVAARTIAEKKAQLGGKQGGDKPKPKSAASALVAAPERKPAPPKPAPPKSTQAVGKKRASNSPFEIRAAPKDPRLLLPENERLAVYSAETKELLLDPPTSVAIVVTEQQFISWCAVGYRGRAGGRGASLWAVELYSRETRQLIARHEIQSRSVIDWCWPVRLRCARTHHDRLIVLSCRSEDYTQEIYVVRVSDTTFVETLDRAEALAALKG